MTFPLSVEPQAPRRCRKCKHAVPVGPLYDGLGSRCAEEAGLVPHGRRIAAPKRRALCPDQLDIFNINKGDDMAIETTGRRRATDQEIAAARAWVEQYTADWVDGEDTERSRQEEYEHALMLLVFANEQRDPGAALTADAAISPPSQPESGSLALEVPEEAPGALGVARGRRRAARLLRSAARNINGMHPEVAQEWLLSTADSFEKAADEAEPQPASPARDDFGVVARAQTWTDGS